MRRLDKEYLERLAVGLPPKTFKTVTEQAQTHGITRSEYCRHLIMSQLDALGVGYD